MTKETMQNQAEDYSHLFDDGLGGFESLSADVVAFPFIRILQSLSPQCKRTDPQPYPRRGRRHVPEQHQQQGH